MEIDLPVILMLFIAAFSAFGITQLPGAIGWLVSYYRGEFE